METFVEGRATPPRQCVSKCVASKKAQDEKNNQEKVEKDELEAMFEHDLRKFLLQ